MLKPSHICECDSFSLILAGVCQEKTIDAESPYVVMSATSSAPGTEPKDALRAQSDTLVTTWSPDSEDNNDEMDMLTANILSDGEAKVTRIEMKVKNIQIVEIEFLPSTYSPVKHLINIRFQHHGIIN